MKNKSTIYQLTTCAIMTALMCILGPMSIPIGPIPVSFTNLVIYLAVYLLGTKGATISYLIYLLLGAVGLPVFSGYAGGLAKLAGPTGGYSDWLYFDGADLWHCDEKIPRKHYYYHYRHDRCDCRCISVWYGLVCPSNAVFCLVCAYSLRIPIYSL